MSDQSGAVLISANDDINSNSNPIFVQEVGAVEVVTPVHAYKASALALNATFNQDYVVVGTKFRLKSVQGAGTNNSKFEIQVGPIATLVTKATLMVAATKRNEQITFDPPIPVAAGEIVRVIQKNIQSGINDVYSVIMGEDVA